MSANSGTEMNNYAKLIDILMDLPDAGSMALFRDICKHSPSAVVQAHARLTGLDSKKEDSFKT